MVHSWKPGLLPFSPHSSFLSFFPFLWMQLEPDLSLARSLVTALWVRLRVWRGFTLGSGTVHPGFAPEMLHSGFSCAIWSTIVLRPQNTMCRGGFEHVFEWYTVKVRRLTFKDPMKSKLEFCGCYSVSVSSKALSFSFLQSLSSGKPNPKYWWLILHHTDFCPITCSLEWECSAP